MAATRHHVVLIPGFAGFDALGQLEYYGGVTALFAGLSGAVLHYFDNFPTAAVSTRAERLRSYLARRIARGEIAPGDEIALVGHSTGGLDIRALLWNLRLRGPAMAVDGGAAVPPSRILEAVRRVVFLSVPHWGTNIADWVRSYPVWREIVVAELRASLAGSQMPFVDRVAPGASALAARWMRAGLFRAVADCLREADPRSGHPTLSRLAEAHEAAAQLDLYLRHIATDFSAIDDLTARPAGDRFSPAHYTPRQRNDEARFWDAERIAVRSYATVGPRLYDFEPGKPAPVWDLSKPWTGWGILRPDRRHDIVYRACYRACAGGPFTAPTGNAALGSLESWDNDGIVNTASMVWPFGAHTLVEADHMDIVGHFENAPAPPGGGRRYRSYDLLGSAAAFDENRFRALWREILIWAANAAPASNAATTRA